MKILKNLRSLKSLKILRISEEDQKVKSPHPLHSTKQMTMPQAAGKKFDQKLNVQEEPQQHYNPTLDHAAARLVKTYV